MKEDKAMGKYYLQCGENKKVYQAEDRETATLKFIRNIVNKDATLAPFTMSSEQGFYDDVMKIVGIDTDEMKNSLTCQIMKCVAEDLPEGEDKVLWFKMTANMETNTREFSSDEDYKLLIADFGLI